MTRDEFFETSSMLDADAYHADCDNDSQTAGRSLRLLKKLILI